MRIVAPAPCAFIDISGRRLLLSARIALPFCTARLRRLALLGYRAVGIPGITFLLPRQGFLSCVLGRASSSRLGEIAVSAKRPAPDRHRPKSSIIIAAILLESQY